MKIPRTDDTIVAVATGWSPAPLGIVRLSGPQAISVTESRFVQQFPTAAPLAKFAEGRIEICAGITLPASILTFRGPSSYTGQDVVEIHTVGSLPLLRRMCDELIAGGARRALPGEFTSRAFLNGKLSREQVEDVLRLLRSGSESATRAASRAEHESRRRLQAEIADELGQALALVEAGIDFVEEEDIRFISPAELMQRLDSILAKIPAAGVAASPDRAQHPHVALVGLPNAGKSTLFNYLAGSERAIVSPVVGTTRDVVSADLEFDGISIVLQDCAGLGDGDDDLDLASYIATEIAADRADLVLWIHAAGEDWTDRERVALEKIDAARVLIVLSKIDAATGAAPAPLAASAVEVSARSGYGIDRLRHAIAARLSGRAETAGIDSEDHWPALAAAVGRARELAADTRGPSKSLQHDDLIALELRVAYDLAARDGVDAVEAVLGRIFSQFCVGK